ncbi:MAG: rhomboid family intramembrane serine protease [Myxococcales bacterium]|nr:rhomboid family intramembrane serine protease [Myxococcales bacterium]
MGKLWFRFLVLWYRLTGATPTQAEWKARVAAGAPGRARQAAARHAEQAADERFPCVCGQLLVRGDRTCNACGRRQLLPWPLRRLGRFLGLSDGSPGVPGTILVMATMVAGYLAQLRFGSGSFMNPTPALETLELGASFGELTLGPQPWRALTYTMLHGGIWHIGFNAMALYQIGPLVERRFGTSRYLVGWVIGAVAGAVAAALVSPPGFIIGASGAVSGIIGMAMLQGHREGTAPGRYLRNEMIKWMVFTTLFGLMIGGVSHAGHFGGLAGGMLVTLLLPPADARPGRRRLTPALGLAVAVAYGLTFAGFATWFFRREVPQSASIQAQALLYSLTLRSQGEGAVFTARGAELLRAMRAEEALTPQAMRAYQAQAQALAATFEPVRAQLFLEVTQEALWRTRARDLPAPAPAFEPPGRAEELQQP